MQRIFVDSRDAVTGDNEAFTISIPTSIVVNYESFAVVDTVIIPTSTYTIHEQNRIVYWSETDGNGLRSYFNNPMITGFYTPDTLKLELQRVLNSNPQKQVSPLYTVSFSELKGKFEIECPIQNPSLESFEFYTTEWLNKTDLSLFYGITDKSMISDSGRALGLTKGIPPQGTRFFNTIICPQCANLQPYSQMFIRGDLGVPFANFGSRGAGNVLRRIAIIAPSNSMNYDAQSTHYDNLIVAPGSYSNFSFELTAWDGRKIDLNGVPWSFSITIFPRD